MSFILDALKKSENERQQQVATEFSTVPSSESSPAAPRWLWIFAGLLVVNLLVVGGLLLRPSPEASASLAAPTPSVELSTTRPAVSEPRLPSFTDQLEIARQNQPVRQAPLQEAGADARHNDESLPVAKPAADTPRRASSEFAGLPGLEELRLNGSLQLPEMRIDMHVYSDTPQSRFVFINGKKYRERETTTDGPVLREITRDGVILDHQGKRFSLNK